MPNNRPEKRYFSFHQLVIARLALLLQLLELRVHINLAAHDTLPTVRKNHTREALYRRGDALAHCKRPHTHTANVSKTSTFSSRSASRAKLHCSPFILDLVFYYLSFENFHLDQIHSSMENTSTSLETPFSRHGYFPREVSITPDTSGSRYGYICLVEAARCVGIRLFFQL